MASGTQRTDGGGEPRPIRGTFSYRGFPPNRAVWFLRKDERLESDVGGNTKSTNHTFLFSVHSHVLGHGGVGDGRGGRVEAGLAAHAAAVAAEAVHVGEVGVLSGYPPDPRVERILLVNVVVIPLPGETRREETGESRDVRREDGWMLVDGHIFKNSEETKMLLTLFLQNFPENSHILYTNGYTANRNVQQLILQTFNGANEPKCS